MEKSNYKILSISDKIIGELQSLKAKEKYKDIDLVFSCGDLPYYYVEKVQKIFSVKTFFVRGNHANPIEYSAKGTKTAPFGAVDIHDKIMHFNNLILIGFEGSVRYKKGPYMYTQNEMWWKVYKLLPKLYWNKLFFGRYFDVLITHAPSSGIHDKDDRVHQGFRAFKWLIEKFKPSYHFHGHIHVYEENEDIETIVGQTKVINTYGVCETIITPEKKYYPKPIDKPKPPPLDTALADFRDSRRKAAVQRVLAQITGKSIDLLPFDFVKNQLHAGEPHQLGIRDIPLDAIVGSVGRHEEFTAKFFPKFDQDQDRWVRVKKTMDNSPNANPIDVYQVDQTFFVLDGNHRVSVARQNGDTHIKAFVSEVNIVVPLSPNDSPDDLIVKSQQVKFLEDTGLDKVNTKTNFTVSTPGCYRVIRNQISSHQYQMELKKKTTVEFKHAVLDWVENVYDPLIDIIRINGLLRDFPNMTYTDLYLLIYEHKADLVEETGWDVDNNRVINDLSVIFSQEPKTIIEKLMNKLFLIFRPITSDSVINPFNHHLMGYMPRNDDRLFSSCLVPLSGDEIGWLALEQAIIIAKKENSLIRGLHVKPKEFIDKNGIVEKIKSKFEEKCLEAGIVGEFVVETGEVSQIIIRRSRWNDLLVLGVSHVPGDNILSRYRSGLRNIIQECPQPILIIKEKSAMSKTILAYDGSDKSNEALYLSAYIADAWNSNLSVISISEGSTTSSNPLSFVNQYLGYREISSEVTRKIGVPGKEIVDLANGDHDNLIIMGGYGYRPFVEIIMGSTIDYVLRNSNNPVLICH